MANLTRKQVQGHKPFIALQIDDQQVYQVIKLKLFQCFYYYLYYLGIGI